MLNFSRRFLCSISTRHNLLGLATSFLMQFQQVTTKEIQKSWYSAGKWKKTHFYRFLRWKTTDVSAQQVIWSWYVLCKSFDLKKSVTHEFLTGLIVKISKRISKEKISTCIHPKNTCFSRPFFERSTFTEFQIIFPVAEKIGFWLFLFNSPDYLAFWKTKFFFHRFRFFQGLFRLLR